MSENIRVHSIIGRFLEHTRVYYFANAEYNVYCASADLMERNLNRRVETCFPICQPELAQRVLAELELYINDTNQRWELDKEGVYTRVEAEESRAAQAELLQKLAN